MPSSQYYLINRNGVFSISLFSLLITNEKVVADQLAIKIGQLYLTCKKKLKHEIQIGVERLASAAKEHELQSKCPLVRFYLLRKPYYLCSFRTERNRRETGDRKGSYWTNEKRHWGGSWKSNPIGEKLWWSKSFHKKIFWRSWLKTIVVDRHLFYSSSACVAVFYFSCVCAFLLIFCLK